MSRASARPLRGLDQRRIVESWFFFFNDTAPTEIYTLSLHDALPISLQCALDVARRRASGDIMECQHLGQSEDRKSTRLNSSHLGISYAVFCLNKNHMVEIITDANVDDAKDGVAPLPQDVRDRRFSAFDAVFGDVGHGNDRSLFFKSHGDPGANPFSPTRHYSR